MRISDKTSSTLTLIDDQSDKKLALKVAGAVIGVGALILAWQGIWAALLIGPAAMIGLVVYARRSAITSSLVFDRTAGNATLTVTDPNGSKTWHWALDDIETASVNTRRKDGSDSGIHRPDLILKDGTRAPMRPYHAAGTQSWHAVAAVKLFLGQMLDDAPVGWIPPEEFDKHFSEEMAHHYQKS